MRVEPGFHLTYCTNIHPGETWEAVRDSLRQYAVAVRNTVAPGVPFGLGLRLSQRAVADLAVPDTLAAFERWLADEQMYVFTLNGFPYGAFHGTRVKDAVHRPDWTTDERVAYTCLLADLLARWVPEGTTGGISTSPLTYRYWWPDTNAAADQAARQLLRAAAHLRALRDRTGRTLHLDLEPEPDGLLENTVETIAFFQDVLLPLAPIAGLNEAEVRRHVRVCYDVCHFAVAYENPATALEALTAAGIGIGKVQVSAALRARVTPKNQLAVATALTDLAEPTYLHQAVARRTDGSYRAFRDLPDVLPHLSDLTFAEWRTHFHVPVFTEHYGALESTNSDIEATLAYLRARPLCDHLEVETYTWEVLPPALRLPLVESISRELRWTRDALRQQ